MKSQLRLVSQGDLDYRQRAGRHCCNVGPFSSPL